jgi:catechol 2,3-dioxygenase-like lactoylglutathione lyase family enzyme
MHVHVSVADIQQSIRFYSALFARERVVKTDYPE